jgi:anti-sigma factor RsiW
MDEQLERLINRSLDGDLSEDGQLELNRELIRNPAARALLAEYQAMDRRAAAALGEAFSAARSERIAVPGASSGHPARRPHAVRWLIPGAIAAALLATVVPHPSFEAAVEKSVNPVTLLPERAALEMDHGLAPTRSVSTGSGAPAVHRNRGRDIIGVLGDDGNLYWIEVEATRTVTLPHGTPSQPKSVF